MSHSPSPVQLSFLGLPTTTGAPFIDYYLADWVAVPAEHSDHYSEKLLLLPPSYIVNDYAQTQGAVLDHSGRNGFRASKSLMDSSHREESGEEGILFGTLSNSQKMDPSMYAVWMNLLRRCSGSKLLFIEFKGSEFSMPNLKNCSRYHGIDPQRLVLSPQKGWLDHLHAKTALDMVLDTAAKNGHTTGLDGVWAGVPTATLGKGGRVTD